MPYLTPDYVPGSVSRHISINPSLIPVFMGSLYECSIPENWETFGNMTPAECANLFQEVMDTMTNYPIGSIHATVGQLPDGCLWCDGTAYLAAAYPLLAAEIDSQFVSGGMITIPDLTGVFLRGGGVVGEYGGEAEHTLTVDEMPAHDHGGHLHLTGQFTGEIPTPVPDVPLPDLFGSRGGGQPHNNLPPFFTVKYFIVAK